MQTQFRMLRGLVLAGLLFAASLGSGVALSTNVQFVGSVGYTYSGSTATLTTDRVENFASGGTSGTLRMELWVFPVAYDGTAQTGYKLAQYNLGQLSGGFYFSSISSGTVPFVLPPNGTWTVAMILTEFDGGALNGGYSVRDWRNFSKSLIVGPVAADVNFIGNVGYSYTGGTAILTADRVENDSAGGISGSLRMELWAFPSPYNGAAANGYKLAQYSLGQLAAGYVFNNVNSGGVAYSPPPEGSWILTMLLTEYDAGAVNQGYSPRDWLNFTNPLVIGNPATRIAVEFHHLAWDHYFVTDIADEIKKLGNGTFVGWEPTGQIFRVYPLGTPGTGNVCRFFSTSFAPRSSHFYTPFASECAIVKANPNWQFEGEVFGVVLPNVNGTCPSGNVPLYRVYNNGQGAAPNHRYTTNLGTRSQMIGQGWIPEGYGAIGVIACVPG
jgi:hypothetical protein